MALLWHAYIAHFGRVSLARIWRGRDQCAGQAAAAFLQRVLHLGTLPLSRNIHELCLISQSGYNKRQGVPALLRGVCMAAGYMDQLVHLLCLAPGS